MALERCKTHQITRVSRQIAGGKGVAERMGSNADHARTLTKSNILPV